MKLSLLSAISCTMFTLAAIFYGLHHQWLACFLYVIAATLQLFVALVYRDFERMERK